MRAPARTLRSAPKRHTGPVRPSCLARQHANRYVVQVKAAAWMEGLEAGLTVGKEHRATDAIARFLGGDQDVDLMTSQEMYDLALLLVRMLAEVQRKRMAIPVEPYLPQPWYAARNDGEDDGDIDVDL